MLTRTITLAGSPNITHTLYFDSRSNATKDFTQQGGTKTISDDYGQVLAIHTDAVVISDLLQNGAEMLRAQGEVKIIEIKAQGKMQKRFNEDAELKVMRDEAVRQQQASAPPANS